MSAIAQGCCVKIRSDIVAGEPACMLYKTNERFDGSSPVILYCHTVGNSGTELQGFHFYGWTGPHYLAAQGFIVIGSTWGSLTNFGNQATRTALETARVWAIANGAKNGPIGLWGDSMGFMSAVGYWADNPANVGKVLGCSPLAHATNFYGDVPSHNAEMDSAWGGSYATNGAARSPHVLLPQISGAGAKLRVHYSHLDATVRPADITAMASAVSAPAVDIEASGAATPSGHVSYLAPQNDHGAIHAHFASLR